MAVRAASSGTAAVPRGTTGVKAWAQSLDFGSAAARKLEVARTKAPATGPESVQRAFALYRTWEEADLGSARLLQVPGGGWAIHTSTDGDDGFLELFDAKGKLLASGVTGAAPGDVKWDRKAGAVRERVAPKKASPSVSAFFDAVSKAEKASSASGKTIAADEARAAARVLLGTDLTVRSIDDRESAAIHRVLADAHELTATARTFVTRLGELYADDAPKKLRKLKAQALGGAGALAGAQVATAEVQGKAGAPRMASFVELVRGAWDRLPSQLVPATRGEAVDALVKLGATATDARKAFDGLVGADGIAYLGAVYQDGNPPKPAGTALFSASLDGKKVGALYVPAAAAPESPAPRLAVKALTGVDREVTVLSEAAVAGGKRYDLEWKPFWGGTVKARVTVPSDGGDPTVTGVTVPNVLEAGLQQVLASHVSAAAGVPSELLGWVGRDDASGPGFIAAHRPAGTNEPVRVAKISIQLGGAAVVTPKTLGAADQGLAHDLALNLARAHAARMVADQSDAAKLEVALKVGWAQAGDVSKVNPSDSAVGFDTSKDRFQFVLPSVWGDNAVFVTYAKDGTVRVEDFN